MDREFASLVNEAFGLRLSSVRRIKRVSQAELAKKVGLSRAAVASLENGNQGVLLNHVFSFARALDVDLRELLPSTTELLSTPPSSSDEAFVELSKARLNQIFGGNDAES